MLSCRSSFEQKEKTLWTSQAIPEEDSPTWHHVYLHPLHWATWRGRASFLSQTSVRLPFPSNTLTTWVKIPTRPPIPQPSSVCIFFAEWMQMETKSAWLSLKIIHLQVTTSLWDPCGSWWEYKPPSIWKMWLNTLASVVQMVGASSSAPKGKLNPVQLLVKAHGRDVGSIPRWGRGGACRRQLTSYRCCSLHKNQWKYVSLCGGSHHICTKWAVLWTAGGWQRRECIVEGRGAREQRPGWKTEEVATHTPLRATGQDVGMILLTREYEHFLLVQKISCQHLAPNSLVSPPQTEEGKQLWVLHP